MFARDIRVEEGMSGDCRKEQTIDRLTARGVLHFDRHHGIARPHDKLVTLRTTTKSLLVRAMFYEAV